MMRDTHRSSYMYMYMCFRIKLYVTSVFKGTCIDKYGCKEGIIENTNQKDALDSLESQTNSQKRKPHFNCFTSAPCPRFYVTIQLKKQLNQRISNIVKSILNAVKAFLIRGNKTNLAMCPIPIQTRR